MARTSLEIVIDAKDNASGVLGRLGGGLNSLAGIAAGAAVAGFAALAGGIALSVGEAMEAEAGLAELEAVIKSTGGAAGVTAEYAQELATSWQMETKFSDDAVISAESMLLTFTNIGRNVFPYAVQQTLNLAEKFGDADQAAIQLGKALNDPINGVSALKRIGVTFTEAQGETSQKMVQMGDVAGAQMVIIAELEKEFGGLAEAAGSTAAGKIEIFKNKVGEVQEQIGAGFLPLIDLATDKIGAWMDSPGFQAGVDAITGGIQSIIDVITPLAEGNTLLALQNFQHMLMNFGFDSEQISSITEGMTSIGESANKIGEAFGKMFSPETVAAAGIITTTVQGLANAMERIASSAEGVQGVVNAFQQGGAGAGLQAAGGALGGEFEVRQGSFASDFAQAVRDNPKGAASLATAGLAGGAMDLAALGQMIVSAIQGAPAPAITVQMDGQKVADLVSARQGSSAQGLARQGGNANLR